MDLNRDGFDDAEQVEKCVGPRVWSFITCTWDSICWAVRGFKTLIASAVLGTIGLADQMDGIDLAGLVKYIWGDTAKVGAILIIIAATFATLRAVTNGPVGGKAKPARSDDGDTIEE